MRDPVDENTDISDPITESRKQKVPGNRPALEVESGIGLSVIVIMLMVMIVVLVIVIVPIAIRAPTVTIFIPPAVAVFPAPGARLRQFVAIPRDLWTVPTMMLGGFVKLVVRADDALLAVFVRAHRCGASE
jgi:hypothetical protein